MYLSGIPGAQIISCLACIDVEDVVRAVRFYREGFGVPVVEHETQ